MKLLELLDEIAPDSKSIRLHQHRQAGLAARRAAEAKQEEPEDDQSSEYSRQTLFRKHGRLSGRMRYVRRRSTDAARQALSDLLNLLEVQSARSGPDSPPTRLRPEAGLRGVSPPAGCLRRRGRRSSIRRRW